MMSRTSSQGRSAARLPMPPRSRELTRNVRRAGRIHLSSPICRKLQRRSSAQWRLPDEGRRFGGRAGPRRWWQDAQVSEHVWGYAPLGSTASDAPNANSTQNGSAVTGEVIGSGQMPRDELATANANSIWSGPIGKTRSHTPERPSSRMRRRAKNTRGPPGMRRPTPRSNGRHSERTIDIAGSMPPAEAIVILPAMKGRTVIAADATTSATR